LKDNILIIGGGGFVGMHLAKFLIKNRDCFLTLADFEFGRDISDYFDANDLEKITFIKNDFTNYQAFEDLNKDFKYVYMLASVVGVNNTLDSPEKVIKTNTSLILNCAEWIKESNVKRLLFTSTSEAYSGTTEVMDYKIPTDERVPLCIADVSDPRFSYAITKILGESIFLNYSKKYSFESTIVRYHNAFGPDMGFKHVIPHLVERFLNQEDPFRMFGFDQTRSFSYIDDTVLGTVLAMESNKGAGEIFHLGSSDEISIETLIKTVGEMLKFKGNFVEADTFPGSVSRRCPDISKAQKILGYVPKYNWKDGLEITVNWYKDYFSKFDKARQDGFEDKTQ